MNKKKLFTEVTLIFVALIISACGPSQADIEKAIDQTETARPTATHTPTNTPLPTNTATPTKTPTVIPSSTSTRGPTSTPNPNLIAKDFIYYFKDNFQFYAKRLNPPKDVELTRFEFVYSEAGKLVLMLETKSGLLVLKEDTPFTYSVAMLASELEEDQKLPKEISEIRFIFRDNDNYVYKELVIEWETFMDYVQNDITFDQLLAAFRKP